MISSTILLCFASASLSIVSAVETPRFVKSCRDSGKNQEGHIIVEDVQTHAAKIQSRSLNYKDDLKNIDDKSINDLILKDEKPADSNLNERSFVYLKQKHRTPVINVVHGSRDGLGKTFASKSGLNEYSQEFSKNQAQSYIEKYLIDTAFFNPKPDDGSTKYVRIKPKYPADKSNMDDAGNKNNNTDKILNNSLKIVELLRPPLVRCNKNDKPGSNQNQISVDNKYFMRPKIPVYAVHPTRSYQQLSTNSNKPNHFRLCSHIYQSHIKDCVNRMYGKDGNALDALAKCVNEFLILDQFKET